MATHDYVLDNASGAAFRTDLNNALAAIVSNNSNSSSPSTTYAYQWWADTSNAVLKIRNSANNAWIELFQLDGTLTLEDGAVGTPALAFRDDLDTGVYSPSDNIFAIASAGVERLQLSSAGTIFNESGADVDFRIEGDTESNLFFVDAGNDRIGIKTNSPNALLSIHSDNNGVSDPLLCGTRIQLADNDTTVTSNQPTGVIEWLSNDSDGSGIQAYICCRGSNTGQGSLHFATGKNATSTLAERFIIDQNGNATLGGTLGNIGNESEHNKLIINGRSGTAAGIIEFADTSGNTDGAIFSDNGVLILVADRDGTTGASSIRFRVDGSSEKARIDKDGFLLVGQTSVTAGSSNGGLNLQSETNNGRINVHAKSGAGTTNALICFHSGSNVGGIQTTSSATSFLTSSDYRLKENATAISDGITRLKTLKPYRFNFKADSSKTVDGFFAHEVTAVPEAISGVKDAVATEEDVANANASKVGDPLYQGVDQSKLVPLLVAAVQELITKVETLEAA